jgi:hypothetical protein
MLLFDVNSTTQVNLENIDAIKMLRRKSGLHDLSVIINGQVYIVDREKHKEFIRAIDRLQVSIQLSRQYHSL